MTSSRNPIRLLPPEDIIKTGDVDQAGWNFHPLFGPVQRKRFRIVVDLVAGRRYVRLLEIGYGSGIFMPELARHCESLFGLDPHLRKDEVEAVLERRGLDVTLRTGTAESIPFGDSFFDAVVVVSAMEYIRDVDAACVEIGRVLAPEGVFVLITPGHSRFLDLAVQALTGESPREQYGDRRQGLMNVMHRHFVISEKTTYGPLMVPFLNMYTALKMRHKSGG